MTSIDVESINSKRTLSFCVINGFDGKFALTLNYGLLSTWYAGEASNPTATLKVNNQFVLDQFETRMIHASNLDVNFAQVEDVRKSVDNQVELFKTLAIDAPCLDGMSKIVPKKFKKQFFDVYDALPPEYQNLYYATYIWSRILEGSNNIYREIRLRSYLSKYVAAHTEQD